MLAIVSERDGEHFAARFTPFQDDARIFHRQPRPDIAVDPFDLGIFMREPAFSDQIENVGRPVLHGDVLDLGAFERDELHHRAMQRRGLELRSSAAFHVGHFAAFVGNNERPLELPEIFRVDSEVSLERMFHFHPGRDVNERATTEDGRVERAEFIVSDRDDFAEPFPENFRMLLQTLGRADENNALLADRLLDV